MERHTGVSGWRWVRWTLLNENNKSCFHLYKFFLMPDNEKLWMSEIKSWFIMLHEIQMLSFLPRTLTNAQTDVKAKQTCFSRYKNTIQHEYVWHLCVVSNLDVIAPHVTTALLSMRHTSCCVNFQVVFPFDFFTRNINYSPWMAKYSDALHQNPSPLFCSGFSITSAEETRIFKPVSMQTMWWVNVKL